MQPLFGKKTYQKIYDLTLLDTALNTDCGLLCASACCGHHDNYGIYLLPGEECMFINENNHDFIFEIQDASNPVFPASWDGDVYFLYCHKACERHMRPMQCRTYPVAPHIDDQGRFMLILETLQTQYVCPLIENPQYLNCFDKTWLHHLYQAWATLLHDPLIYDLVLMDSENRHKRNITIKKAYGI